MASGALFAALFLSVPFSFADDESVFSDPSLWKAPDLSNDVPDAALPAQSVAEPAAQGGTVTQANDVASGDWQDPNSGLFPEPPGLKANVDFWLDVYTKYTEKFAIIHDSEDLSIRYEVVDLSQVYGRASRRYISRQLTKRKKYYGAILQKLAHRNGECADTEECRVAAIFGNVKEAGRYRSASENLRVQYGLSNRFRDGLETSGQYMAEMRKIFSSHDLPIDLVALPHVESSFNVAAYSRVGAAGIWQFMRSTGRHFLKINRSIDERRDPIIATDGAARFLKRNYSEIGSWPLTIISYNHGKNGILHAQRKYGNDVEAIIKNYKGPAFGFASRNFYTEFLAARKIMLNPERYFSQIDMKSPIRYATIRIEGKQGEKALKSYGAKTLASLNPAIPKQVFTGNRPLPNGYVLRVPAHPGDDLAPGESGAVETAALSEQGDRRLQEVLRHAPVQPIEADRSELRSAPVRDIAQFSENEVPENMQVYTAKRGDTLSSIAKKFKTSVAELKDLNEFRRHRIRTGQKIFVPKIAGEPEVRTATLVAPAKPALKAVAVPIQQAVRPAPVKPAVAVANAVPQAVQADVLHTPLPLLDTYKLERMDGTAGILKVKSEEAIGNYANWAGTTVVEVLKANGWRKNRRLSPGREIKVPLLKVTREKFEDNRYKYHQKVLAGFLASNVISGVNDQVLKRGQTLWTISEDNGNTPVWLLSMYNQDKQLDKLKPGEIIRVPVVHRKVS